MFLDVGIVTALVLGAVQGLTEFLPISSDGHLAIAAMLLGETESSLSLVILLHVGTLAATAVVLREDVRSLLVTLVSPARWRTTEDGAAIATILVASIPTALVGLALRDVVEPLSRSATVVGACLLLSALAVASTRWSAPRALSPSLSIPVWKALVIGLCQGLAVLPGLTRSGSTIGVAMLLGLSGPTAFRLSFLLSLPAVLGAVLLELVHPEGLVDLGGPAFVGAGISFLVGLVSLLGLRQIVARGRFWAFALYLAPLGAALLAFDLWGLHR